MKYSAICASALALALPVQAAQAQEHDHSQMDHSQHPMAEDEEICLPVATIYRWTEGSGTSRLPGFEGTSGGCGKAASPNAHSGLHIMPGDDWMVMVHGYAWGVYTDQSGPRGDDKAYVQSMAMLQCRKGNRLGQGSGQGDDEPRTADEKSRLSQSVCHRRDGRG